MDNVAGLLDSKRRIFDTIVTDEGRRQLATGRGKMRIRFASFTDQDAYYEADHVSGATDASVRPHLEVFSRPQDTITFQANDVGDLLRYEGTTGGVVGGHVLISSGSKFLNFPTGSVQRREAQLGLLTSSLDNFTKLYLVGDDDPLDDDMEFRLSDTRIRFDVVDGMLSDRQGISEASLDDVEGLFQDRRLSHVPNFTYMPPRNRSTTAHPGGSLLGQYARLGQGELLELSELMRELEGADRRTIRFSETSRDSNVFVQVFDLRENVMRKLTVIDFGEFPDPDGGSRHVFFVGRLFQDTNGVHTFVNIFTLVYT